MTKNVVSFSNYKKARESNCNAQAANETNSNQGLVALDAFSQNRKAEVAALTKKIKSVGGFIYAPSGDKLVLNPNSMLGFDHADINKPFEHLREGSNAYVRKKGKSVAFVVMTSYPLLSCTAYLNYYKKDGMYLCQAYVYQYAETVPSLSVSSWLETISDGLSLMDSVVDKSLEKIFGELKKRHDMSLFDYDEIRHIGTRQLTKYKSKISPTQRIS